MNKLTELTDLEFVKDCLEDVLQVHYDRCVGLHNDCDEQHAKAEALVTQWHEAIQRVRELHKPREKTCFQEVTIGYPDGTQTIDQREVVVCDWCQYLVDFPNDYSTGGVAPYPCPTIEALDGEQE